jgi:hypothetical protein
MMKMFEEMFGRSSDNRCGSFAAAAGSTEI